MAKHLLIEVIILGFFFSLGAGEADKVIQWHVVPSLNTPCLKPPCLTLADLATSISYFDNVNTSLRIVFLEGNHVLDSNLIVSNVSKLALMCDSSNLQTSIVCSHNATFSFSRMDSLQVKGLVFIGCGNNIIISVNRLVIDNSTFIGQKGTGTALQIIKTNATIMSSHFSANMLGSSCLVPFAYNSPFIGGAIVTYLSDITITNSSFADNRANLGGAVFNYYSNISIISSNFTNNQVTHYNPTSINGHCFRPFGSSVLSPIDINLDETTNYRSNLQEISYELGTFYLASVVATFQTKVFLYDSFFNNNTSICGGAISFFQHSTSALIYNSEFTNNSATQFGGVFVVGFAKMMIHNCLFYDSYATQGGVLKVGNSNVSINCSIFKGNKARLTGGVLRSDQRSQIQVQNCTFIDNQAYVGGVLADKTAASLILVDSVFLRNVAKDTGGVIFTVQSKITFRGACSLSDNNAQNGGAIYLSKTEAYVYDRLSVTSNVANHTGGGIYLFRSNLDCQHGSRVTISHNYASINGGGIHAIISLITMYCDSSYNKKQAILKFYENISPKGGGICLESYSFIYIFKTHSNASNISLYFASNKALEGEAIYVSDDTYFEVCGTQPYRLSECFIQVLTPQSRTDYNLISNLTTVEFTESNSKNSLIFGGLLDRCSVDRFAEIVIEEGSYVQASLHSSKQRINGVTFLKMISNLNDTNAIRSTPVRLCFCTPGPFSMPNCSYTPPPTKVTKGEKFNISLVAVDQVNHTIANITIHAYLNSSDSGLDPGQTEKATKDGCTNLTYSISSPDPSVQLILYAEGPCRNASRSQKIIHVSFRDCECPIGFQRDQSENNCQCSCDSNLVQYIYRCNSATKLLTRDSSAWISYINDSNSSGYLIYHYCPFDYCLPEYPNVQINLNTEQGADAQCAHHRSGLLCGQCKPGHSLSYGSSHCLPCPKRWYLRLIVMTMMILLMGVCLVALLMFLNMTVAVGTINGLIFYSNIIGTNENTFPLVKFFSVVTSLLNLRIEVDTCFFVGMDTFWKTWLQLAFPTYLIVLVIIIIVLSQYSMRFSQLIAKKNPVATLATLILLSYTTYLQSAILILSFGHLHYPDGSFRRVWLADASIDYLRGRHITLFIVAVFILIIGVAYICILFTWQWLLHYEDKPVLTWVRSAKLKHFIEPYHAPYKFKHRYWTGLLLFVRVFLYFAFAFNISGDPKINLTAIVLVIGGILFYKGSLGQIYRKKTVDVIEMVCYLNICSFSAIQLFVLQRKTSHQQSVNYAAYLSGIVTFTLLIAVVLYHAYSVLHVLCLQKFTSKKNNNSDSREPSHMITKVLINKQSSTEIEGLPNWDRPNAASQDLDDVASIASTDSTTPLLDE